MYVFTEKTITLRGVSRIGDADAAAFEAVISSVDPLTRDIRCNVVDPELYKENIKQCRQDEEAFRDCVQNAQDEMLSAVD